MKRALAVLDEVNEVNCWIRNTAGDREVLQMQQWIMRKYIFSRLVLMEFTVILNIYFPTQREPLFSADIAKLCKCCTALLVLVQSNIGVFIGFNFQELQ